MEFNVIARVNEDGDLTFKNTRLLEGQWEVAVINIRAASKPAALTCDVCEPVSVFGKFIRLLYLHPSVKGSAPTYRRVTTSTLDFVKLKMYTITQTSKGIDLKEYSARNHVYCELHFRRANP